MYIFNVILVNSPAFAAVFTHVDVVERVAMRSKLAQITKVTLKAFTLVHGKICTGQTVTEKGARLHITGVFCDVALSVHEFVGNIKAIHIHKMIQNAHMYVSHILYGETKYQVRLVTSHTPYVVLIIHSGQFVLASVRCPPVKVVIILIYVEMSFQIVLCEVYHHFLPRRGVDHPLTQYRRWELVWKVGRMDNPLGFF